MTSGSMAKMCILYATKVIIILKYILTLSL